MTRQPTATTGEQRNTHRDTIWKRKPTIAGSSARHWAAYSLVQSEHTVMPLRTPLPHRRLGTRK